MNLLLRLIRFLHCWIFLNIVNFFAIFWCLCGIISAIILKRFLALIFFSPFQDISSITIPYKRINSNPTTSLTSASYVLPSYHEKSLFKRKTSNQIIYEHWMTIRCGRRWQKEMIHSLFQKHISCSFSISIVQSVRKRIACLWDLSSIVFARTV